MNVTPPLFLSSTSDELVRVDPTTGSATRIGAHSKAKLYGLAYDRGGVLYGFQRNSVIWSIDPTTAAATYEALGPYAFGAAGNPFPSGSPVPEPSTLVLVGGALALGARARRRPVLVQEHERA